MEVLLQDLPCCEKMEQENLVNAVEISIVSETNKEKIHKFLLNNDLEHNNISLDDAIVCTIVENDNSYIVGLLCFEQNHPSTKVPVMGECNIPRKFYELTYVFMERKLWHYDFLAKIFSIIFTSFVQEDDDEYVFWFVYMDFQRELVKKGRYNQYYCQNEGSSFAGKLLQAYGNRIKHEDNFWNNLGNLSKK